MTARFRSWTLLCPLTVAVALVAGCGGGEGGDGNPRRLYLAPLDSELTVQLVDAEPAPF